MDYKTYRFLRDSRLGVEDRVEVNFACRTCSIKYPTMREALLCGISHEEGVPPNVEPLIEAIESRFDTGELVDFMSFMELKTHGGELLSPWIHDSETLLEVLDRNSTWLFRRDRGNLAWNTLQLLTLLFAFLASTVSMFRLGQNHDWLFGIAFTAAWGFYIFKYWEQRRGGWLGYPIPIIPWRVAVVFIVLATVSFTVGWWW